MSSPISLRDRRPGGGILRLDLDKPRKPSTVEFREDLLSPTTEMAPVSPQPSVDRLSVTFAGEEVRTKNPKLSDLQTSGRFQIELHENEDDDEDYSASVNAIISRRQSSKRRSKRRRPSTPFSQEPDSSGVGTRRRSSVFTTSSVESGASAEETTAQELIFHKMKIHKEVLSQVRYQPWPLRKKVRLVQTAKAYIKRHEGALQERLAQNKSTKDILEHCNIIFVKLFHKLKREVANLSNVLIPWEGRIKEIESHFGSVVASYFTFLRWLFSVNLVLALVLIVFVAVPEMLRPKEDSERKTPLPEEEKTAANLVTLWNFEGVLKYSPMFYGFYNVQEESGGGYKYRLPLAYFMTGLAVYIYSFVAILRKMAENSRQSKLSEKEDECTFSWKIFTGWDFMIGNAETANNRTSSIILGFKELLLEEAEKHREEGRNWKMTGLRVLGHLQVLGLILTSVYAVVHVVQRSTEPEANSSWWRQSEVTVVFNIIGFIYPILFDGIGYMERYHPRKALRMQLARIMVLNLLNLYSFIFATFSKIHTMSNQLQSLKPNYSYEYSTPLPSTSIPPQSSTTFNSTTPIALATLIIVNTTLTTFTSPTDQMLNHTAQWNLEKPNFTNYHDDNFLGSMNESTEWEHIEDILNLRFVADQENETSSEAPVDIWNSSNMINQYPQTVGMETTETAHPTNIPDTNEYNMTIRKKLRGLCWETMFGQELVKLTVMDMLVTISSILMIDFFRALFVRLMNNCWCWDLEKRFPQYGDFKIAENILHLVNNQGMVWMGMFFCPLLPLINLLKLIVILYMRSWAVMTCNIPHEVVFKASRSNNFYFALLLTMLFLCVLPVGYAIVAIEPSWHCGPFSNCKRIHYLFIRSLKHIVPKTFHKILDYVASPGVIIPLLMLLVLIIYYLISLTNALREANNDLKIQLRRERTEERRKVYQLADKKRRGTETSETPFAKWSKLLDSVPERSSVEGSQDTDQKRNVPKEKTSKRKEPIKKSSTTASDDGVSALDTDEDKSHRHDPHAHSSPHKTEPEFRPRENSVTSAWSVDNIPKIQIEPEAQSKSSSVDTVIAVGLAEGRKKAPLALTKSSTDDLSEVSDDVYTDMTESIKKIHSLTNINARASHNE